MGAPVRYFLYLTTFFAGVSGNAMAQQAENGNSKPTKQTTEVTTTNAATAQKAAASTDKNDTPPSEKRNWAIRIKQGAKWYQLSLELAY